MPVVKLRYETSSPSLPASRLPFMPNVGLYVVVEEFLTVVWKQMLLVVEQRYLSSVPFLLLHPAGCTHKRSTVLGGMSMSSRCESSIVAESLPRESLDHGLFVSDSSDEHGLFVKQSSMQRCWTNTTQCFC